MLQISESRYLIGDIYVEENGENVLIKTVNVSIDTNGISNETSTFHNQELCIKHLDDVREAERELLAERYRIEDEIMKKLKEKEAKETKKSNKEG